MGVAFHQAGIADLDEAGFFLHFFYVGNPAIAHAGAQAAEELENGFGYSAFIGGAAFNAFGNQLLGVFLEITVTAALGHGAHGTHAAINFESAALEHDLFAGAFVGSGQQIAEHDDIGTGRN